MSISIALHLLSVIIWVGGMFFAHMLLRPAAAQVLEPPLRLQLWVQVFRNFFLWVWIAIIILLVTGYWMVFSWFGGFANVGLHVHIMHGLGIVMIIIFMFIYFSSYRKLRHAVIVENFQEGGIKLTQIRRLVGINILIGLAISVIASAGRYL
ncbi:MAG: CopD family protein [Gammaproteobacteria bacterium]|nr:CopD family protein [Gammaproteobacteria bacterium]